MWLAVVLVCLLLGWPPIGPEATTVQPDLRRLRRENFFEHPISFTGPIGLWPMAKSRNIGLARPILGALYNPGPHPSAPTLGT